MKTLIILMTLISISFASDIDSILIHPFNMDMRNDVDYVTLVQSLGAPVKNPIPLNDDNILFFYPTFTCYLMVNDSSATLYSIEITKGYLRDLKIGMSKRDILKKYAHPNKNGNLAEFLEYYQIKDNYKYSLILSFKKDKLKKILIVKDKSKFNFNEEKWLKILRNDLIG